ncbi:MAG: cyclic nucleotide-binding/CBS domain-containing protein [Candidatus Methylomirabilales bacterium]
MTPIGSVQYNFGLFHVKKRVTHQMAPKGGTIMRPLAVMMNRDIRTIGPDATLAEAARAMRDARVGALLVAEREHYLGVVSETDLVRKAMAEGLEASREPARSVMSSPVITMEIDCSAHQASDLMAEKGIRHLAITEDGRVVGIISVRDLLRYFKNWGSL